MMAITKQTKLDMALLGAVVAGRAGCVRQLLKDGADIEAAVDEGCQTVLHWAAWLGRDDICALLLELGVDINKGDGDRQTPLHKAAAGGRTKTCERLLNSEGINAEALSIGFRSPLQFAAATGHTDTCRLLIEYEFDVNAGDKDGLTPLHRAAMGGHADTCGLLFVCGASVNAGDKYGRTPLGLAEQYGHPETAEFLRSRGGVK